MTSPDPALDPPLTIRAEHGAGWAEVHANRAIRTTGADGWPWHVVTGPLLGDSLCDDDVRAWPVVADPPSGQSAFIRLPRE
ncbi:MAG: hypothetical protein L0H84_24610 [Pseudonocardia sp.]|nr:hypothetical protein [Pseudonocardia sp.]